MRYFIFLLCFCCAALIAQVNHNGDLQLWIQGNLEPKILENLSLRLAGEARCGDNLSTLYLVYGQAQLVYQKKSLEIAPGYRQSAVLVGRRWETHYIPMVDITFSTLSTWTLEDRSRIFYLIPERGLNTWIYRNRLRLITPEITGLGDISLYLDDEVFFSEHEGFRENRLGVGFFKEIGSISRSQIGYIFRNLKNPTWTFQNVLYCAFFIKF